MATAFDDQFGSVLTPELDKQTGAMQAPIQGQGGVPGGGGGMSTPGMPGGGGMPGIPGMPGGAAAAVAASAQFKSVSHSAEYLPPSQPQPQPQPQPQYQPQSHGHGPGHGHAAATPAPAPPPAAFAGSLRELMRFMRAVNATSQRAASNPMDEAAVRATFHELWRQQSAPATQQELRQDLQNLFVTAPNTSSPAKRLAAVMTALDPQTRQYFHEHVVNLSAALRDSSNDLGEAAALLRWLAYAALPAQQHLPEDEQLMTTAEVRRAFKELDMVSEIVRPDESNPTVLATRAAADKRIQALRAKLASMGVRDTREIEEGGASAPIKAAKSAKSAKPKGGAAPSMPGWAIALLVIGIILVVGGIVVAVVFTMRNKRKMSSTSMSMSGPGAGAGSGSGLGSASAGYNFGGGARVPRSVTAAATSAAVDTAADAAASGVAANLSSFGFPNFATQPTVFQDF
jgi:hypothetical protein